MIRRIFPVQRISERVLGPTRFPDERVTPASPLVGAARVASTKTSATVTALPSELPVRLSVQIDVKASANL
jgi:hypothetical protein